MTALWALLGGVIAIVVGIFGLIKWFAFFLKALAATVPVILIFGGAIACFIGFSELRDSLKSKDDTDFSDFKSEGKAEENSKVENKPGESQEKGTKSSKKK